MQEVRGQWDLPWALAWWRSLNKSPSPSPASGSTGGLSLGPFPTQRSVTRALVLVHMAEGYGPRWLPAMAGLKAHHGLNSHRKIPEHPLSLPSLRKPWALGLVVFSSLLLLLPSGRAGHAGDARQTRSQG